MQCRPLRRDRGDGRQGGGIAIFAEASIATSVTLLVDSTSAEGFWVLLHTNHGPFLLGAWHRPPESGETLSIESLRAEIATYEHTVLGVVLMGDCNVHQQRWLHLSTGNSVEGTALQAVCHDKGLRQMVREPTRDGNLLDLVMSSVHLTNVHVSASIADHKMVHSTLQLAMPKRQIIKRMVWSYQRADWEKLAAILENTTWEFLDEDTPSVGAEKLTATILAACEKCISRRVLQEWKSTHPWLTEQVVALVAAKKQANGTANAAS